MTTLDLQLHMWRQGAEFWRQLANMQIYVMRQMMDATATVSRVGVSATEETAEAVHRERDEILSEVRQGDTAVSDAAAAIETSAAETAADVGEAVQEFIAPAEEPQPSTRRQSALKAEAPAADAAESAADAAASSAEAVTAAAKDSVEASVKTSDEALKAANEGGKPPQKTSETAKDAAEKPADKGDDPLDAAAKAAAGAPTATGSGTRARKSPAKESAGKRKARS